jgi:hypothetical protein
MPLVELEETPEYRIALDNLEQMHPQYLGELLKTPRKLRQVIKQRVLAYLETLERLRKANPNLREDELKELAQPEHLTPVNLNWQDETPLTAEQKAQVRKLRNRQS